jgi:Fic family protein
MTLHSRTIRADALHFGRTPLPSPPSRASLRSSDTREIRRAALETALLRQPFSVNDVVQKLPKMNPSKVRKIILELVEEGVLQKLSLGIYGAPGTTLPTEADASSVRRRGVGSSVEIEDLLRFLETPRAVREVSRHFCVTPATIHYRTKELLGKGAVVRRKIGPKLYYATTEDALARLEGQLLPATKTTEK